jgi:hypothetical protein
MTPQWNPTHCKVRDEWRTRQAASRKAREGAHPQIVLVDIQRPDQGYTPDVKWPTRQKINVLTVSTFLATILLQERTMRHWGKLEAFDQTHRNRRKDISLRDGFRAA